MRSYEQRDRDLLLMGFASYPEYLESDLWKSIRKRTILKAKRRCSGCAGPATQVHHRDYSASTLKGETENSLVAICRDCHSHIEFKEECKCTLAEANGRLDRLISKIAARAKSQCPCGNATKNGQQKCRRCRRNDRKKERNKKPPYTPTKCACGSYCKRGCDKCRRCLLPVNNAKTLRHRQAVAAAKAAMKGHVIEQAANVNFAAIVTLWNPRTVLRGEGG